MKLNILWMYHNIMDLYGDRGNIQVLKKRCNDRGIEVTVDTCDIGEEKDIAAYDLLFIGGGADREQNLLREDLLSRKEAIVHALDQGIFVLLVCGGFQFFGQYYVDNQNQKISCLGLFDYYTQSDATAGRCIGNVEIEANLDGEIMQIVGFENHGGQTHGVHTPLGKVIYGHGNEYKSANEGFYNGQVLGTYIHGPLLPKNPELADFVIKKALYRHNGVVSLKPLDDALEHQAKEVMQRRLRAGSK